MLHYLVGCSQFVIGGLIKKTSIFDVGDSRQHGFEALIKHLSFCNKAIGSHGRKLIPLLFPLMIVGMV